MKKTLAVLTLSSLSIAALHADPILANNGFYLTGDLGYGYLFTPNSNQNSPTTGGSYSHGGIAGNFGGGYRWAIDSFTTLGLELDYLYNGKATYNNDPVNGNDGTDTFTQQGAAILATFGSLWSNGFNIFAKAGMADIFQKQSYSSPAVVAGTVLEGSNTNSSFEFIADLGAGYMITQSINLFIQGQYIAGNSGGSWTSTALSDNNVVQSAQVTGGLSYYF